MTDEGATNGADRGLSCFVLKSNSFSRHRLRPGEAQLFHSDKWRSFRSTICHPAPAGDPQTNADVTTASVLMERVVALGTRLALGSVRRGAEALLGDGCESPSEEACVVQNAVAVAEDSTRSFV